VYVIAFTAYGVPVAALPSDVVSIPFAGKVCIFIIRFASVVSWSKTCPEKSIVPVNATEIVNPADVGFELIAVPTFTTELEPS